MAKPSIISNFNVYSSGLDAKNKFTVVDFKRKDGTMFLKSTLSNPDANTNYLTMTHQYYNNTGLSVMNSIVYTLTYDASNNVTSIAQN
jgi:hypothetical protein